jgi:hypothetical protein
MRTWTIQPYRDKPWRIRVWLYGSKSAMRAAINRNGGQTRGPRLRDGQGCEALFSSYRRENFDGKRWVRHPEWGAVYLHAGKSGVGTVAHEMLHAALACPALKIPKSRKFRGVNGMASEGEEALCWLLGALVAGYWIGYWNKRKTEIVVG